MTDIKYQHSQYLIIDGNYVVGFFRPSSRLLVIGEETYYLIPYKDNHPYYTSEYEKTKFYFDKYSNQLIVQKKKWFTKKRKVYFIKPNYWEQLIDDIFHSSNNS